jgi:hypothetical protein
MVLIFIIHTFKLSPRRLIPLNTTSEGCLTSILNPIILFFVEDILYSHTKSCFHAASRLSTVSESLGM